MIVLAACADVPLAACPAEQVCTVAGIPEVSAFSEALGEPALGSPLYFPQDLVVGPSGEVYLAEYNNHRVVRIDADGSLWRVAGTGSLGEGPEGDALTASLNKPASVLLDPGAPGQLIVTAWGNHRLAVVDLVEGTLRFVAGQGGPGFAGDGGDVMDALFDNPSSVAVDEGGVWFVADEDNQVVRRIDPSGLVHTIAGTPGVQGWAGDDGPAHEALLNSPIASDGYGPPGGRVVRDGRRLLVVDTGNHALRAIDLDSGTIDTVAGGPEAEVFVLPSDVAVAPDGSLVVADTGNHCLRRVTTSGDVTVLAGRCGVPGFRDGAAADALFFGPFGIDVDADGSVWVADTNNHVVRRVATIVGPAD